ncbi:MAG: NUDIX hydrolase [Rhodobacter sp.]|nr:NUDIX hydrolase [Rhodobacter sp.]MCA3494426.1 NUDIX hydrolase [Rhodobacter sp.]MCA3501459.1 NUDIX hydrolase [Rhodobacter sp.]MCA3502758.1 NUDIX hydrolase [Rhodobacter sp.]MCA3517854.1 NUDIX hydrolase [Rhodobacter sp.]
MRGQGPDPRVLMGQRGAGAVFMPSKYVFPGGAVDADDALVPVGPALHPTCAARLAAPGAPPAGALAAAAIRELWEETGLALGRPGQAALPPGWAGFAAQSLVPDASALRFFFRAITPPGRTRRFDARFFLADAARVIGDPDDFSAASDELGHLHWLPLSQARDLDLPFITEVVLAEVAALAGAAGPPPPVPFFDNSGPVPAFRRIG